MNFPWEIDKKNSQKSNQRRLAGQKGGTFPEPYQNKEKDQRRKIRRKATHTWGKSSGVIGPRATATGLLLYSKSNGPRKGRGGGEDRRQKTAGKNVGTGRKGNPPKVRRNVRLIRRKRPGVKEWSSGQIERETRGVIEERDHRGGAQDWEVGHGRSPGQPGQK